MSRLTTLGWLMEIRSWRGQVGIRIPEIWFGGPYLSWGGGFGIGWYGRFGWGWNHWGFNWAADTRCMAAAGTTPAATPFITEAISTAQEAHAVVTVCAAEMDPVLMPVTGLRMETLERAAKLATAAQPPGLSKETPRLREDTPRHVVKAASAPARLADIRTVGRSGPTPRRGSASMGAAHAGGGSRGGGGGSHASGGGGHGGGGHR